MLEKITINSHSSIRIETEVGAVYCDPFEIMEASADAALIMITHSHYDHFSPDDIRKIMTAETQFLCPMDMEKDVKALNVSKERIHLVMPGDCLTVCGLPVEVVSAYNPMKPFHPKENNWVGYIITTADQRIYIAGDTNFIPEHRELRCDIAMVPIGGTYTMDAEEAAQCVNAMKPKLVIPTHYGSIVGQQEDAVVFKKHVDPAIDVVLKLFS